MRGAVLGQLRQQVYLRLREGIETGVFAAGARLPPSREHAHVLGVSRNTVLWAVERLQSEGYLVARVGDGTYVAKRSPPVRGAAHGPRIVAHQLLSQRGRLIAETGSRWNPATGEALPFRLGRPALEEFPFAIWDRLERKTPIATRVVGAGYTEAAGHPPLRAAIAQWLLVSRGIRCDAGQVLITAGSQQALDLVARLLLDVGDEVLVEDPGYPGIRANLIAHGALVRPVPVDAQGLCIAQGAPLYPRAKLAVVTPTHQFPLGVPMSLARRSTLIEWARANRAWIVEDDYDGEFQYGAQRIPALCSMAHDARVLHVGTFSKSLGAGLRLGFIVLPDELVDAFTRARALSDRQSPGAVQDVLARFIAEGHLLRHLRRMRELYRERQASMIHHLTRATNGTIALEPSLHGMHLAFEVGGQIRDTDLSRRAQDAGVHLAPISSYCIAAKRRGWLFGYAGYDEAALARAARALGQQLG
ncbi:PLP-dependent aminotransferase family protein [Cupriavidus basilensis]|uniref:MocR-like pyridoxine biosynthesis transcription factor PdxR n=1 Tax=Cupriavidus basilensis TaxID=68895 RepID=UPI00157ADB1C|nr:PLP-dependent aminotransferase family protein [Cupriavidus basilensis]NUA29506.1 PLP-dependent aminotransferase family protein [Cupriavidus basilensis]